MAASGLGPTRPGVDPGQPFPAEPWGDIDNLQPPRRKDILAGERLLFAMH